MANAKIMPRDVAGLGTLSTFQGAEVATLPSSNMLTYGRTPSARWSTPTLVDFRIVYPSAQEIDTVALCFHNLSAAATVNVFLFSDTTFTTQIYQSTPIPAFAPTGFTSVLNSINIPEFKQFRNTAQYTTRFSTVRSIVVQIADSTNPDGYIDIGRVMAGRSEQFAYGDPYGGVNLAIKDMSTSARAGNGSIVTDKGPAYRELQINKQYLTEVPDASGQSDWNKLLEAYIRCGSDKEFFYSQFPSATNSGTGTTEEMYYQGVFKFGAMSAIDRQFYKLSQAPYTLVGQ
jgi:hypothetical protein